MPAKAEKPAAEKPLPPKKNNPTCGTCRNTDPDRVNDHATYCTLLGQWCKKIDSRGSAVTVMPCNGKWHGQTVDMIRKKKGLPTLAEVEAASNTPAPAPVETPNEDG